MTKLLDSRGFGLISVMVAAAIGMIVALAIANLLSDMQLSQNNIKFRTDGDTINEEIRALLSSPAACLNSFKSFSASAGATYMISDLKDGSPPAGVVVYSTGNTYGDRSVVLRNMTLSNYIAGAATNKAEMTLTNNLDTAKQSLGSQGVARTVRISLEKDSANKITACVALAKMSDGIWQRSAANLDDIFFAGPPLGGDVGIDAPTPRWRLQINSQSDVVDGAVVINHSSVTRAPSVKMFRNNGTATAPVAVASGQTLGNLSFGGFWRGKANPEFVQGDGRAQINAVATENWITPANNGSAIAFATAANGTNINIERLRIDQSGNVGMNAPQPYWNLQINSSSNSRDGALVINHASSFRAPSIKMFRINGSLATPSSVLSGQVIGDISFSGLWGGKSAAEFQQGEGRAQIGAVATENWTSAGHNGTAITFDTAANGTNINFERMRIDQSGNVGLGTQNPSYRLDVQGSIRGYGVTDSSDVRLKTSIQPLRDDLSKILQLDGVSFYWRDLKDPAKQIGFVAQEVEKIFPELVKTDQEGIKSVNYSHLTAPLVGAVKELIVRLKKAELELNSKDRELSAIKTYLCVKDPHAPFCQLSPAF